MEESEIVKHALKAFLKKLGIQGRVRNHSSKVLWVIESTSNDPHGPPIAHRLAPGMKSPASVDADGFKRFDEKPIAKHKAWWKITDLSTADIFDDGKKLFTFVTYKSAVDEDHFGTPSYAKESNWGEPINYIVGVKRKAGRVTGYYTSILGFLKKREGVKLALEGKVDLAVIVNAGKKNAYLRSYPGQPNFSKRV